MPQATLTYNLPEETEEFDTARNGSKYQMVLHDLDQALRSKLKYEEHSEEAQKCYQEVRDKLHELLNEEGVQL